MTPGQHSYDGHGFHACSSGLRYLWSTAGRECIALWMQPLWFHEHLQIVSLSLVFSGMDQASVHSVCQMQERIFPFTGTGWRKYIPPMLPTLLEWVRHQTVVLYKEIFTKSFPVSHKLTLYSLNMCELFSSIKPLTLGHSIFYLYVLSKAKRMHLHPMLISNFFN